MTDEGLHVFIDESGDNKLDSSTTGADHLFHLVAVVVDDKQKSAAEQQLDIVSRRCFGNGEIKSRNIGSNDEKRRRALEAIREIDFGYYGFIVNKDRILMDSGYQWKTSFYKATRRKMYAKLANSLYDRLSIYSHRIGSQEYMDSFGPYLRKTEPTLFSPQITSHSFISSGESRLVQLADFIAGTLRLCFDASKSCASVSDFRSILAEKELAIDVWPIAPFDTISQPDTTSELDKMIYHNLLDRVRRYLIQLGDSNSDEDKMRECVLCRLLLTRLHESSYICSDNLIALLDRLGYGAHNSQWFTSKIMGKIRDAGIIIAGTSQGYRLALSVEDIHDYLEHNRNVILPMLTRIKKAKESVSAATLNKFDILENDGFFSNLVALLHDKRLEAGTSAVTREEDESIDA